MKYVVAVIKPFKLGDVHQALSGVRLRGLTVSELREGGGCQKGYAELYRGAGHVVAYLPKAAL